MPTLDPQIVTASARLLPRYGPDFSYSHFWACASALSAAAMVGGAGAIMASRPDPGGPPEPSAPAAAGLGPEPGQREKSWFTVRFFGQGRGPQW